MAVVSQCCVSPFLGELPLAIQRGPIPLHLKWLLGTLWTGYLLFGGRRFARLLRSDGSPIRSRIASSRFLICAALIGALPACAYRHLHLPWPLALQPGEVAFVAFESAVFLMLGHLLLAYTFFGNTVGRLDLKLEATLRQSEARFAAKEATKQ